MVPSQVTREIADAIVEHNNNRETSHWIVITAKKTVVHGSTTVGAQIAFEGKAPLKALSPKLMRICASMKLGRLQFSSAAVALR